MAMLGAVNYSVSFTDYATYFFIYDKWTKWTENHLTLYDWI